MASAAPAPVVPDAPAHPAKLALQHLRELHAQVETLQRRAPPWVVDAIVAQRMGTTVDDRRVKLVAAVWGGMLMTALQAATRDLTDAVSITVDDLIDAFEATYTDFVGQIAPLRQLV